MGRTYEDYQAYMARNPDALVSQMDSVVIHKGGQVIVADRGSEFTDPMKVEADPETGEIQCRVFYCDPMNSNQKSNCERNHELIRYVIPKNQAKECYTKEEIREMMNHINSYPRKKWNGQAPIDLFVKIYGQEAAERLGLKKIPSDSIHLTPALLKK